MFSQVYSQLHLTTQTSPLVGVVFDHSTKEVSSLPLSKYNYLLSSALPYLIFSL